MTSPSAAESNSVPPVPSLAIVALSLSAFASGLSQRVTDPLLPRLALDFGTSIGAVSWVVTLFTVGYGLNQLFFGPIGDRFGKYLVIGWACIASSVATLLCAFAPDLPMLLAARFVAGAAIAANIPLAMAWIGDVIPYEQRQPVLARFLIGQILGVAAGQLLGGIAADYLGWRTPFFLIAALLVAVGGVLFSVRRRLPAHALEVVHGAGHPLRRMFSEFALVLDDGWVRTLLLTVFLEGASMFGAFAFFASHLHAGLGVSLSAAGSMVMLFGFGGFLFATGSRTLVRRLGETGLARWGAGIICVSLTAVAFGGAWWIAAPACFTTGLGFYMLHNTLQTNATQMAPARRGAAVSAFAFCYFLGQSAGVAAAGLVVGRLGTAGVIVAGGAGVLCVGLAFAGAKHRRLAAAE